MWTYTANLFVAHAGGWDVVPEHAQHFWSLAIEEQFYIVWAPLILYLSRARALLVCGAVVLGAPLLRSLLLQAGYSSISVYVFTPCRLDPLAAGAFVALYLRGPRFSAERVIFAGLGMVALLGLVPRFIRIEVRSRETVTDSGPWKLGEFRCPRAERGIEVPITSMESVH
jgi:peptidoglycan/LPS O-acetylase OafA/YrhL